MIRLHGIVETCLYVADLERSTAWYRDLFDLEVLNSDDRFCALSVADRQVLLLFRKGASDQANVLPGGVIPAHDGAGRIHVGFSIAAEDVEAWERRLADRAIAIEGRMRWGRGGTSLYFRDPDGHLLELLTPGVWRIY